MPGVDPGWTFGLSGAASRKANEVYKAIQQFLKSAESCLGLGEQALPGRSPLRFDNRKFPHPERRKFPHLVASLRPARANLSRVVLSQ